MFAVLKKLPFLHKMKFGQDGQELDISFWEEVYSNVEERAWARYISNSFRPDTLRRWWNDALY